VMAAAPALQSRSAQMKQELIVTRLAHRLGLRQETVWARLGELKTDRRKKERQDVQREMERTLPKTETPSSPGTSEGSANGEGKSEVSGSSGESAPTSGHASKVERNLLQVLLADPGLLPKAAAEITPNAITHSGLRRILMELYAAQAAGAVPDIDMLRERLSDRRDLFEAVLKLQDVGLTIGDRELWLNKILNRFSELKTEAEQRALKNQLPGASDDQKLELLRKLQQNYVKTKKPNAPV